MFPYSASFNWFRTIFNQLLKSNFEPMKFLLAICLLTCLIFFSTAKDGYELWLDESPVDHAEMKAQLDPLFSGVFFFGEIPTYEVIRKELEIASQKILGKSPVYSPDLLSFANL